MTRHVESFDYMVVGAGYAVGARLLDNPEHRVLVLEAGENDYMPFL